MTIRWLKCWLYSKVPLQPVWSVILACVLLWLTVKELSSGGRSAVISRDNPIHVDHINRFWDRFSAAMRDKDLAIQAELSRFLTTAKCFAVELKC